MIGTLSIPIGFAILAAVLGWYVIGAKGSNTVKAVVIALACLFSTAIYASLDTYQGWPSGADLPDKFLLVWVEVDEPSQIKGDPGAIYVWTKLRKDDRQLGWFEGLLGYESQKGEPRSFRLEYTRQRHKAAQKARKALKQGKRVEGRKGPRKPGEGKQNGKKGPQGQKQGEGKKGDGGDLSRKQRLHFYELPPPKLPEKVQ